MFIKEKINKYNQLYTKELDDSLVVIIPLLIEAFVKVYGEKNRDYIANSIASLKFIYFLSENYLLLASDNNPSREDIDIIKTYLEHFKELEKEYQSIPENKEAEFIINNYTTRYPFSIETINYFYEPLGDDFPAYQTFIDEHNANMPVYKTILLPIFAIDIHTIIHEINHALVLELMADSEDSFIIPPMFLNITSEEINNDFISSLVLEEYIRLGGIIPKPLKRFIIKNPYQRSWYLLPHLYKKLGPLITESLITRNHNLFYNTVGYNNVLKLSLLIEDLHQNGYNALKFNELNSLIDEMSQNKTIITDYESYYRELKSLGYKVRIL